VVGLLGLAGRWGNRTRFWLPAALTWVGSGALAAFDGLNLVLNQLFRMFGMDAAEADWSLIDTVLVIKVVIGVLAAVGALAVTGAAKDQFGRTYAKLGPELSSREAPPRRTVASGPRSDATIQQVRPWGGARHVGPMGHRT
jgi:hypothetical protein